MSITNLLIVCFLAGISVNISHSLPVTERANMSCPSISGDIFLAQEGCTKFYRCTNGVLNELTCPGNLYWNTNKEKCDYAENVSECVGGTRALNTERNFDQTTDETYSEETSAVSTQETTDAEQTTPESESVTYHATNEFVTTYKNGQN